MTFGLCVFFVMPHVESMGKSESRSNGKVVKGFHPIIYAMKPRDVWTLYFFIMLHTDPMGKGESRPNGRVVKGFHPIIYVVKSRDFWTLCFL